VANRRLAEQSAKLIVTVTEHYKVILAYDGTAFKGMQRQRSARTVQGELESALRKLGWAGQSIRHAGRTDAGVHASGQVVAFKLDWGHSEEALLNALNATLPEDVAARSVSVAAAEFQPRYDAKARRYRYQLFCQAQRDPLRERYAWRVWPSVKLKAMRAAAKKLVGSHDFKAFGSPMTENGPTVRHLMAAEWSQVGEDGYAFEVTANAFLYHMVRRMVGLQVRVGQGLAESSEIAEALSGKIELVQHLAPAAGLTLVAVEYD
jgi:tRNA pseudouridine38-40 synthase